MPKESGIKHSIIYELAFDQLRSESAKTLLLVLSFLSVNKINVDFLHAGSDLLNDEAARILPSERSNNRSLHNASDTKGQLQRNRFTILDTIGYILAVENEPKMSSYLDEYEKLSLVRWAGKDIQIHELHRSLLHQCQVFDALNILSCAMYIVIGAFDSIGEVTEQESWHLCEEYLPHVRVLIDHRKQYSRLRGLPNFAYTVSRTADYLFHRGRTKEALELYEISRDEFALAFGQSDLDTTVRITEGLALACLEEGELNTARQYLENVRSRRLERLTRDHPDTLGAGRNLAQVMQYQGHLLEAQQEYESLLRTMQRSRKMQSQSHKEIEMAYIKESMAMVTCDLGDTEKAQALLNEVLEAKQREKVGVIEVLRTYQNVGSVLRDRGLYDKSHQVFNYVLSSSRPEHPISFDININIGFMLIDERRYSEARVLFQSLQAAVEQNLVSRRTYKLLVQEGTALLDEFKGYHDAAQSGFQQLLITYNGLTHSDNTTGKDHHTPAKLRVLEGLAMAVGSLGRLSEAVRRFHKVIEIEHRQLPPNHPDVFTTYHRYGRFYARHGNSDKARKWYGKAIAGRKFRLGGHHPATLHSLACFDALGGKTSSGRENGLPCDRVEDANP